jgi:hypothetical protein
MRSGVNGRSGKRTAVASANAFATSATVLRFMLGSSSSYSAGMPDRFRDPAPEVTGQKTPEARRATSVPIPA